MSPELQSEFNHPYCAAAVTVAASRAVCEFPGSAAWLASDQNLDLEHPGTWEFLRLPNDPGIVVCTQPTDQLVLDRLLTDIVPASHPIRPVWA